ncbi:PilZ domain-containing protein [Thalassoglobus polymorphus]|uniref:PilZ domain protein n=1 Tax=Thalassoglobus polymorphus TaxID=2527994 RepID=A0A517QRE7_9PLAN|nr:PilZ domain-containing protein [Thalassoglobus polymorphus]QDT34200.1 PilZ domain protein [Thalassoglobus polymorphus]
MSLESKNETNTQDENDVSTFSTKHQLWTEIVEQRREGRVDFRATGNAFPLGETGDEPLGSSVRFWTVDVSTTGALIRTCTPLECQRMFIELFMPQLANSLIEVEVVRTLEDDSQALSGKFEASFLYGLQFLQIVSKEDVGFENFERTTEVPFLQQAESEIVTTSITDRFFNDTSSKIPFTAAMALVVLLSGLLFLVS